MANIFSFLLANQFGSHCKELYIPDFISLNKFKIWHCFAIVCILWTIVLSGLKKSLETQNFHFSSICKSW